MPYNNKFSSSVSKQVESALAEQLLHSYSGLAQH